MSKKTTKEKILEEPSVESSESLSPEEFDQKYLDLDELLYLSKVRELTKCYE